MKPLHNVSTSGKSTHSPSITDPDVSHTYDCIDENKTSARVYACNNAEVHEPHPSALLPPNSQPGIPGGERGYAKPETPGDQYETLESQNCQSTEGDQYETPEKPSHTQNLNFETPGDQYETLEKSIHTQSQNCQSIADQYEALEQPHPYMSLELPASQ